ncbi:MAG: cation-transporting P-type ATPase, partial [Oscillospiraceae bacterium]|nr:cation-transporting P-type ATPase [Oscillospiraceae bacterium]
MFWHTEHPDAVLADLGADRDNGLTAAEAVARLQRADSARPLQAARRPLLRDFTGQLKKPAAVILLAAAAVSAAVNVYRLFQGETVSWTEPGVMAAVLLLSGLSGLFLERRAAAAIERLKNIVPLNARVIRDGGLRMVSAPELVPGDIIEIQTGDVVPADARVLSVSGFRCDESALTGESGPVEKSPEAVLDRLVQVKDRINMVYAGCPVIAGHCRAVVAETGINTETGKLAGMSDDARSGETPLRDRVNRLEKLLLLPVTAVCAVIFLTGLIVKAPPIAVFVLAAVLAAALIPKGLSGTAALILAGGAGRMRAKRAVIKKLPAVEALASTTVICTGKTGILTNSRMALVRAWLPEMPEAAVDLRQMAGSQPLTGELRTLIQIAVLCSDGAVQMEDGRGDPTDAAIAAYALHSGMEKEELQNLYQRLGAIPFDS